MRSYPDAQAGLPNQDAQDQSRKVNVDREGGREGEGEGDKKL